MVIEHFVHSSQIRPHPQRHVVRPEPVPAALELPQREQVDEVRRRRGLLALRASGARRRQPLAVILRALLPVTLRAAV